MAATTNLETSGLSRVAGRERCPTAGKAREQSCGYSRALTHTGTRRPEGTGSHLCCRGLKETSHTPPLLSRAAHPATGPSCPSLCKTCKRRS